MKHKNRAITWLFLSMTLIAANLSAQSLDLTGYARNYIGILLKDDNEYAIVQNTFDLNFEHSMDKVAFKANSAA